MKGTRRKALLRVICCFACLFGGAESFSRSPLSFGRRNAFEPAISVKVGLDILEDGSALSTVELDPSELAAASTVDIKQTLKNLLQTMTGTPEDFKTVETLVNTLESRYTPVQTLDFLNLAMTGEWQLLFSTNLSLGPRPNFRLRELLQRIEPKSLQGTVENEAVWEWAEDGSAFKSTGTFTVQCSYKINQGSRMVLDVDDNVLRLAKGTAVPDDIEALVGLLHRAMPKEMFDPTEHAMDTTYLDGDLRIVRMAGSRFEGVRDIFIRRGSFEINPTDKR